MHSACRTRKRREPGLRITSRRVASASRSALGWRAAARGQSRVKLSGWLCLCQSVSRMATSHGRRMTAEQRAKRQQVSFAANEIHVHVQQSSRGCQASRISSCLSVRVSAKESFAKRCNRSPASKAPCCPELTSHRSLLSGLQIAWRGERGIGKPREWLRRRNVQRVHVDAETCLRVSKGKMRRISTAIKTNTPVSAKPSILWAAKSPSPWAEIQE